MEAEEAIHIVGMELQPDEGLLTIRLSDGAILEMAPSAPEAEDLHEGQLLSPQQQVDLGVAAARKATACEPVSSTSEHKDWPPASNSTRTWICAACPRVSSAESKRTRTACPSGALRAPDRCVVCMGAAFSILHSPNSPSPSFSILARFDVVRNRSEAARILRTLLAPAHTPPPIARNTGQQPSIRYLQLSREQARDSEPVEPLQQVVGRKPSAPTDPTEP